MPSVPARSLLLAALLLAAGCAGPWLFTDGSSVSIGTFTEGLLRHGVRLPPRGRGYLVPALWRARGNDYGTDEIVAAIEDVARRVAHEYPGGTLGIGDLSQRGGGANVLHRSHEDGRDADLIYYAVDARGRPVLPVDSMPRYSPVNLRARAPRPPKHGVRFGPFSPRWFDVPRNWALVRALLQEPRIDVQYLFINRGLRQRLLDYARARDEDPSLVARAAAIMHQPGDSLPHDDHLHLRIFCAATDRVYGCVDRGPERWWKKRYKYMAPSVWRSSPAEVARALLHEAGPLADWPVALDL